MPDGSHAPSAVRCQALDAVAGALEGMSARALTGAELLAYQHRAATNGWRLVVEFPGGQRRLDVLVDGAFPRSQPRVMLVDRPPFLTWPHVEHDGALCLLNGVSEVSAEKPVAVVSQLLGEAAELVEDLIAGRHQHDLQAEFTSYWDWSVTPDAPTIRSILSPAGPSRDVWVWRGKRFYLLGETQDDLTAWLTNFGVETGKEELRFESACLLWRDAPLLPIAYPSSGPTLLAAADATGRAVLLDQAAAAPQRLVVALGAPTANGICFGGVVITRGGASPRGGGRRSRPLDAGFRPGHVPKSVLGRRYLDNVTVARSSVERLDAAWVHGRERDPRQSLLRGATITVIGCGSIGAAVALLLAQAGVGRLRLVDPDILKAANISRHPLGADDLGRFKASALARRIRQRYPHLRVDSADTHWETLPADFDLFGASDLIICATGSWAAESALNDAHRAAGRSPAIVYGWTEANACAGHAVVVGREGGCLRCGIDALGRARDQVTLWPANAGLHQEPACGAFFQPYGAAELAYIVSMIAELSLDNLLGEVGDGLHRLWIAPERRLRAAGGAWADHWAERRSGLAYGGIIEEQWSVEAACPCCAPPAAAA